MMLQIRPDGVVHFTPVRVANNVPESLAHFTPVCSQTAKERAAKRQTSIRPRPKSVSKRLTGGFRSDIRPGIPLLLPP
jgi:hypothetical protein